MHRYRFRGSLDLCSSCRSSSGISIITFILVRLIPAIRARNLLGARATPSAIAKIRAQYGLDEPMWQQYFYLSEESRPMARWGKSILYKIDVLKLIATRIEPTVALVLSSVVLAVLIAVPMARLQRVTPAGRRTISSGLFPHSASAFRRSGSA